MIDIESFKKSLRAIWINKYLDPVANGKLSLLQSKESMEAMPFLKEILTKKDVGNLRIEDPFVKEIAIIKKKN